MESNNDCRFMPTILNETQMETKEPAHHEFLFGGVAYTVSVLTLFPLYKTIFFQQLDGISWPEALNRFHHEGFRLAYRGVLPPLLQRATSGAVMFGVQSLSERALSHHPWTEHLPAGSNRFTASVFAGFCEAPLMPFERVQTLLQNKHFFPSYRNTFHTVSSLTEDHGLRELYRGFTPILLRNCIGNALYFSGHKFLNDMRLRRDSEGPIERSLWNFTLGGVLGGLISFFTFPFNVTKTRMQTSVGGEFETLRSAFSALLYHRDHRLDITRLYRGMPANFLRTMLSWGIITMTYHFLLETYSGVT